jgi:hypothetical protein
MNIRHASALALIGWYLIMPPIGVVDGRKQIDTEVPLWKWQHPPQVFSSSAECEQAKAARIKEWSRFKGVAAFKQRAEAAQCVSQDDSRLKSPESAATQ